MTRRLLFLVSRAALWDINEDEKDSLGFLFSALPGTCSRFLERQLLEIVLPKEKRKLARSAPVAEGFF